MTLCRNGAVRCDTCGKLSSHQLGEYAKADGSAGYIRPEETDGDGNAQSPRDICEECSARAGIP